METSKKFKIGQKEFVAKFPNVGQMLDMESLKQALTNNRYGVMAASGIRSMYKALDTVDAIAFFQVCAPEVAKYFSIESYIALSQDKIKVYVDAYNEQIKPWFEQLMQELENPMSDGDGKPEGK